MAGGGRCGNGERRPMSSRPRHTTKPFRLTCKACGRLYKVAPECPQCGVSYPVDDPGLDLLTRHRIEGGLQAEARQLSAWPDQIISAWIGDSPHRLKRALAAKGYATDHVWPPIPALGDSSHHCAASRDLETVLSKIDHGGLAGPKDTSAPRKRRPK